MNGEHFYEEFKAALNFLGVTFHEKGIVKVRIQGEQICMSFRGKEARIGLPVEKEKDE